MPSGFLHRLLRRPPPQPPTPGSGALLGERYRLEAEIGRGGLGIVYHARDLLNARDVAIKVMNPQTANALARRQFLQELEIHARLHHPHIVAMYESGFFETGAEEPLPFLVMELVQGTGLDAVGGLTYTSIVDIARQLCQALDYIHNQGLVYRDLKPANVLLERHDFRYVVKLIDFGLARPRGSAYLDRESSLAGTVFYLAPELIAGGAADAPADLYALGATLYEMITGRVPFSDYDEKTILGQHQEDPVPPLSASRGDVPPALEAVVLRLLAKRPEERFASAAEVLKALEGIAVEQQKGTGCGNIPDPPGQVADWEEEITQVRRLLAAHRLVTLGGEGKPLAQAAGAALAGHFADGAWWVDLSHIDDPAQVLETVTTGLKIPPDTQRSPTVALIAHLREKDLLLVLAGCDLFRAACAQLLETILTTCPGVFILATSEEPLTVSGEKFHRASPQC